MTESIEFPKAQPEDSLDELVIELLACGGALSQMITGMVEFAASGRSAPDAPSIPDVARSLIRSVCGDLAKRHSNRDVRVAAAIVREATDAICNDIFAVNPDMI